MTTKRNKREELHRTIWNMANDLRGSVDGWDFKQYVLGMLFYRYISENFARYVNAGEIEAGNADFDYANLSDSDAEPAREELVDTKGYFILPSELFCNVRKKAPQDDNLNETLEKVFRNIESSARGHDSEDDLKGLFDDLDVNSNKFGGTVEKRMFGRASLDRKSILLHIIFAVSICSCMILAMRSLTLDTEIH